MWKNPCIWAKCWLTRKKIPIIIGAIEEHQEKTKTKTVLRMERPREPALVGAGTSKSQMNHF